MKTTIQTAVAKEVIKELEISPTGKRLIIITMLLQIPFVWLAFATQIVTCILLGIALTHIKVVERPA